MGISRPSVLRNPLPSKFSWAEHYRTWLSAVRIEDHAPSRGCARISSCSRVQTRRLLRMRSSIRSCRLCRGRRLDCSISVAMRSSRAMHRRGADTRSRGRGESVLASIACARPTLSHRNISRSLYLRLIASISNGTLKRSRPTNQLVLRIRNEHPNGTCETIRSQHCQASAHTRDQRVTD